MRFRYKKIRSTAAAALLSSLASLALAPGLLLDASRSGDVLARVLPQHAVTPKPRAQVSTAIDPEVTAEVAAIPVQDQLDPTAAHEQPAGAVNDSHIASISAGKTHTGYAGGSFAIGSGWRATTTRVDSGIPATTAAINPTFVPTNRGGETNTPKTGSAPDNDSPLKVADDESNDATNEDGGPDQTSDETDFADAGDDDDRNNGDSYERPHLPVATVPEPSSLALLSVGIAGLLISRHRAAS